MRPKKSLGQNFLTSPTAIRAIIKAAELSLTEAKPPSLRPTVLEIGPGKGILTEALLATGARVIAVEKDDQLYELLRQKFAAAIESGQLELIHDDILHFAPRFSSTRHPSAYRLVANIPYYLTGEIIRLFLADPPAGGQPELMVLMLQKEVAERIVAKGGKESILSMSVKAFGEPKYIQTIKAGSFFPKPKVDSAILMIKNISHERLGGLKPEDFFTVLHAGFSSKRKVLKNNLKAWPHSTAALAACTIDQKLRAENLNLNQWIKLTHQLINLSKNGKLSA